MHTCFSPCIVYGIREPNDGDNYMIEKALLEEHGIQWFTGEVVRGYAYVMIYGCVVSLEEFKDNYVPPYVNEFAKKFNLPEPTYHIAISGDYILCHEFYTPETVVSAEDNGTPEIVVSAEDNLFLF